MTTTHETGHAKNAANFDQLIAFVTGYDTAYNPSKSSIQLPALQSLSTKAKNSLGVVNATLPAYSNAVAAREVAFMPLNKLATRLLNSLIATDTSTQVNDNAKSLVRKIQGTRAIPKKTEEEKAALAAEGKSSKEISSSQMSFDNRLNTFALLIQLLSSNPLYTPNETELKVATLEIMYDDLNHKNAAVITATIPLSNARIARNEIFYNGNDSLVDTAANAKAYIKSVFGAGSPQYRQVSGLTFTTVKA
jgi:hypothetical protein